LFFSIVLFSFSMASQDVANLRRRLRKRVADLERANRIIERLATTDALTGVYNRHHINNILLQQLELLSRYGCPLSIAILDLDHFKAINDQFGHNVGDEVLKTFCKIARESLRKSDWFGRWGGEEFICIMPHTTVENAHIPMNRIRQAFKSAQIASLPSGYQHTVSIGIAEAKLSDTVDSVIARADERLYQAKRNGRDTIVVSKASQQPEA
jgi:diguanylate cyclase (GGDEF)-like protein